MYVCMYVYIYIYICDVTPNPLLQEGTFATKREAHALSLRTLPLRILYMRVLVCMYRSPYNTTAYNAWPYNTKISVRYMI